MGRATPQSFGRRPTRSLSRFGWTHFSTTTKVRLFSNATGSLLNSSS